MKRWILIFVFCFIPNFLKAGIEPLWESKIFWSSVGSCETHNLNFSALRFTKIPLISQSSDLFLRVILFVRPDRTLALRLTTQQLLGCQTSSSGQEVCSYKPISNRWLESSWSKSVDQKLVVGALGLISYDSDLSRISVQFAKDFSLPEVAGLEFSGSMVLVNFDDHGVNTANLCSSLYQ